MLQISEYVEACIYTYAVQSSTAFRQPNMLWAIRTTVRYHRKHWRIADLVTCVYRQLSQIYSLAAELGVCQSKECYRRSTARVRHLDHSQESEFMLVSHNSSAVYTVDDASVQPRSVHACNCDIKLTPLQIPKYSY